MIIKFIYALLLLAQVNTSCYAATTAENFDQSTTTELDREKFDSNDQTKDADDDDRDEAVDEQHSKAFLLEHKGKIGLSLAAIAATLGSIYCFTSTSTEDTKDAESKKSSRPKEKPNPVGKDKGKGLPAEGKNKKQQQDDEFAIKQAALVLTDDKKNAAIILRLKDHTTYRCSLKGFVDAIIQKGKQLLLLDSSFYLDPNSQNLIANQVIGNHSDVRYPIYLTGKLFWDEDGYLTHLGVRVEAEKASDVKTLAFGIEDRKLYSVNEDLVVQDSFGEALHYLKTLSVHKSTHQPKLSTSALPQNKVEKKSEDNPSSDGYISETDPEIGDGSDSARTWLPLYHRDSKLKAKVSTDEPADNKVSSVLSNESTDNEVSSASVLQYSIEFGFNNEIYHYSLQDCKFRTYVLLDPSHNQIFTEIKDESKVAQFTRLLPFIFLKAYKEHQERYYKTLRTHGALKAIVKRNETTSAQQLSNEFFALRNIELLTPEAELKSIYQHLTEPILRLTIELEGIQYRVAFNSQERQYYELCKADSPKMLIVNANKPPQKTLEKLFPQLQMEDD